VLRLSEDATTTVSPSLVTTDGHGNTLSGDAHSSLASPYTQVTTTASTSSYLDAGGNLVQQVSDTGDTSTQAVQSSQRDGNNVTGDYTDHRQETLSSHAHEQSQTFAAGVVRMTGDVVSDVAPYAVTTDGHGNTISGDAHSALAAA